MSRRFQFSIRLMLVGTAAVAAAVGAVVAKPSLPSVVALELVAILLASVASMAAMLTLGRTRTFWFGVAMPTVMGGIVAVNELVTMVFWRFAGDDPWSNIEEAAGPIGSLRFGLVTVWCFAPVNGLLCVLVHWLTWPRPSERDE